MFISHVSSIAGLGVIPLTAVMGYQSVNVFFTISGFLVAKSLFTRNNMRQFFTARILRIYPALLLAVLYTALIVGLSLSSLSTSDYLSHPLTFEYLWKNILQLFWPTPTTLPGLPWSAVNAPLWTLPFEIHMYLLLGFVGAIGLTVRGRLRTILWGAYFTLIGISVLLYTIDYAYLLKGYGLGYKGHYLRFLAMFGVGVAYYMLRSRVVLRTRYFITILIVLGLSAIMRPLFVMIAYGALAYCLLYLAYIPGGPLRLFNKLGDYSYGIYIFGYPTQKAVMQLLPGSNAIELFVISLSITLAISAISWHFIERPAIGLKRKFTALPDIKKAG